MKFLLALALLIPSFAFGDAVIFSGADVLTLKQNIDLFRTAKIMATNTDPRSGGGLAAPTGSIAPDYVGGNLYVKRGAGNTNWELISNLAGSYFKDGGNSFGHTAQLGTTDANNISILRNSTEIARFGSVGLKLGTDNFDSGSPLDVEGSVRSFEFVTAPTGTQFAGFFTRKSNGTFAAPTAVQSGNTMGFVGATGYGATGFGASTTGIMQFVATENFTDTAQGTSMQFRTTPNGSVTKATRMTIEQNGTVTLGVGAFGNSSIALGTLRTDADFRMGNLTAAQEAAIVSPQNGMYHYDTTNNKFRARINGAWADVTPNYATTYFQNGGNSFGTTTSVGTNDNQALRFQSNGTVRGLFDPTTGYLKVGDITQSPQSLIEATQVSLSTYPRGISSRQTGLFPAAISVYQSRGTPGAESAIQNNDVIGDHAFFGYGASAFPASPDASMRSVATENFSNTAHGNKLQFLDSANGSVASAVVRMTLGQEGHAAIGTSDATTSASLDLQATDGALLLNRLTTTQKNALTATAGMSVYDSTLGEFDGYGVSWLKFLRGQASLTTEVTGTLPIANGGTNATTASVAINNLLPTQSGNAGKFLTTDATSASWGTPPGSIYGTGEYTRANNCNWTTTSVTYASFAADTDCNTLSVTESLLAPTTKIPAFRVSAMPAGTYLILAQGPFGCVAGGVGGTCGFEMTDGSAISPPMSAAYTATTNGLIGSLQWVYVTGTAFTGTIEIKAVNGAGDTAGIDLRNSVTVPSLYFSVTRVK